jgi:predicted enzyme related to lactoylglutathione lyase
MRISLAAILVEDQDNASRFYSEILGFRVETDAPYGSGPERWLTVVAADDPKGLQLELALADDAGRAYQRAQREAGKPAIAFTTGDCQREYEQLVARGVTFTLEPTKMPYGGTDAIFDDTCGNLVGLHQD